MGKSRAASFALGYDIDEGAYLQAYSENVESTDPYLDESSQSEGNFSLDGYLTTHGSNVSQQFVNLVGDFKLLDVCVK